MPTQYINRATRYITTVFSLIGCARCIIFKLSNSIQFIRECVFNRPLKFELPNNEFCVVCKLVLAVKHKGLIVASIAKELNI